MSDAGDDRIALLALRHLRIGWGAVLLFAALGIGLETLHGFKVAAYVAVSNETRRAMWTLAHAHGGVLGLINVGFALTSRYVATSEARRYRIASSSLLAATVLIPTGFFLGGCFIYDGDPGLGILLVPAGGLLLLGALALMILALRTRAARESSGRRPPGRNARGADGALRALRGEMSVGSG